MLAVFVLFMGIRGAVAAPEWLPANTSVAGYQLKWGSDFSIDDFTTSDDDDNITYYAQLWLKNDTATNVTNLLAAGMIDKGGAMFSKSAQITGLYSSLAEGLLCAILNISQSEYDAIGTVWEVVVMLMNATWGTVMDLSEVTISNMDKAMVLNDTSGGMGFDYMLFGYAGDKVLTVFAFSAQSVWINWLSDITANNATLATQFENVFYWVMFSFMLLFLGFAALFHTYSGGASASMQASDVSISPSSISTQAEDYDEMVSFASAWGAIADPAGIPGYETVVVLAASGAAFGALAFKARKARK